MTKRIAGKIVPAIASATALIVGTVLNEAIKVFYGFDKLDDYKMCFINLALPLFLIGEPPQSMKNISKAMDKIMGGPVKAIPEGFTIWDRLVLKGPMKIGDIIEYFKKEYGSAL